MSESSNICSNCSHENKPGAKFCVNCGTTIVLISSEKIEKFKSYLQDMILDGDDPRDHESSLLNEAVEDIGIPLPLAKKVFEEICSSNSQSNVGIRISYDSQLAKRGVAQGNSILVIRVDNLTNKSIGSVSIAVTHPEEGTRIEIGKVRSLAPQKSKSIETTLRFNLVGPQLIREGQIKVESLSGLTDIYLIASPIRMSTENSNASRHIHTAVTQTITTHGGGVVDGSGFKGVEAHLDKAIESWETVRLMRSNFNDKPDIPNKIEDSQKEIPSQVQSTIQNENIIEMVEKAQDILVDSDKNSAGLGVDVSNDIEDLVNQGDSQAAKLLSLNEFVRLLSLYPKAQIVPKGKVYLTTDIDLVLLTNIASTAKIKRSDINAIAVNKLSSDSEELESFQGDATVFSGQGLIIISSKDGSIELVDKYGWSFLNESSWGIFRQSIGHGSYIFSLGDESTDYCLPNLTFDLRKNNGKFDLEELYERLKMLFDKIKSFSGNNLKVSNNQTQQMNSNDESREVADPVDEDSSLFSCHCAYCDWQGQIGEALEASETDEIFCPECGEPLDSISDDNDLDEEPEVYQEQDLEEDELEFAVRQFFIMFAFVSQYCDRQYDRPVHVFVDEENGGDVDLDLARSVQALFPKSKLVAICEDDLQSSHDKDGRLLNWSGLASVVTRDGIFNVNSDGQGNFDIASKQAFLSWSKFFEDLDTQLIVRYSVPDIWLGTKDNYFIKGCYIDYSNNIDSFIYFEEFFHKDLIERYEELRQIVVNA